MSPRPFLSSAVLVVSSVVLGACDADRSVATLRPDASASAAPAADLAYRQAGRGNLHRFVAIGTSVSQGFRSDGVVGDAQRTAWPALLARLADREFTVPAVQAPGCRPPMAAPLATGVRVNGLGVTDPTGYVTCAPLEPGITLPANNVAIVGSLTLEALTSTPDSVAADPGRVGIYNRTLGAGQTQVTAMLAQQPKFVTIELGANEVLGARTGVAIPGVSMFPVAPWKAIYTQVVTAATSTAKGGVLVGLISDVASFPSFRRGDELWQNRGEFAAAFNVQVAEDCQGSPNLLFVPVRVPVAVATGVAMARAGQGPATLSCAGGAPTDEDWVLTPAEASVVNAQMAEMSAFIKATAQRIGYAYFELDALYGLPQLKAPYSVVTQMTSAEPYGTLTSLDGIHPSAAGAQVLAEAAASAINDTYGWGLPVRRFIASR